MIKNTVIPIPKLTFKSETIYFNKATEEYKSIWSTESRNIVQGFLEVTALPYPEVPFDIVVFEGASESGNDKSPMKLRASYPNFQKLGTLIHEMGHRHIDYYISKNVESESSPHQTLYLFLYELWTSLYGEEFAKKMVKSESQHINPVINYAQRWKEALAFSPEERKEKWLKLNKKYKLTEKKNDRYN